MTARNARAHEVSRETMNRSTVQAGAYTFLYASGDGVPVGIIHGCPCGCGGRSALFFLGRLSPADKRQVWTVEGEWPNVTLSPSIGIKYTAVGLPQPAEGGYHWHGYLRAGVFEEC